MFLNVPFYSTIYMLFLSGCNFFTYFLWLLITFLIDSSFLYSFSLLQVVFAAWLCGCCSFILETTLKCKRVLDCPFMFKRQRLKTPLRSLSKWEELSAKSFVLFIWTAECCSMIFVGLHLFFRSPEKILSNSCLKT